MKSARHQAILDLIEKYPIDRQEEDLLEHLRRAGFDVTQATVSRDIRELRLVKTATGRAVTAICRQAATARWLIHPTGLKPFSGSLCSRWTMLGIWVLVKCFSGMANAACEVFDAQTWEGVVGTLSGDDTFFILMRTGENAAEITRQLQRYTVRHHFKPPEGGAASMLAELKIENVAVIEKSRSTVSRA